MKVFMTGATGYIGSAVASAFVNAGHELTALVRESSDSSRLSMSGVRLIPGELNDLGDLGATLEEHDVLIHLAQDHGENGPDLDQTAVDSFTRTFNTSRTVIYTSGVWVLGDTGDETLDEDSKPNPIDMVAWRVDHENEVLDAGRENDQIRTVVIRPGCVYGGRESLLASWFEAAESGAPLEIVGDGENRWAMVYLDDVADLYLRVAEHDQISGVLHAIDDSRVTLNELAGMISEAKGSSSQVQHIPLETARESMGGFADALAIDQQISSEKTCRTAGWAPSIERIDDQIERLWSEWEESSR